MAGVGKIAWLCDWLCYQAYIHLPIARWRWLERRVLPRAGRYGFDDGDTYT